MQKVSVDQTHVMRTAAWIWIGYWLALAVMDLFVYANRPLEPIFRYHLVNGLPALIFLGLSYSRLQESRANPVKILMILLISFSPILFNHLYELRLPPAPLSNIEGMTLRQLPVLFIGLVLVAWHFKLVAMVLYSVSMNLFELLVVNLTNSYGAEQQTVFHFIMVSRTISFIVVGVFINQLVTRLRAQQDSLKLANQQLAHYASTLENLTISRERNRMSRELHDTVVHTLSGLAVQLETSKAYLTVNADTASALIDQSLEATRAGLRETRRAIKALRASPLEDLGLIRAIQQITETAAQRGRLLISFALPEQNLILSPDVEQCIFRITQEAVENVVHHANAHKIMLKLAVIQKDIELLIQDDGIGFDPRSAVPNGHFGLASMRERAQMIGGELSITSLLNGGTTIHLWIRGCIE